MSDLFHIIPDAQVICRAKNGTFFQRKVYRRGDRLYAAWGGGFIRLGAGDATSNPNVSYESLDMPSGVVVVKNGPQTPPTLRLVEVKGVAA